ncbi:hypothetical protein C8J57DRAFT_242455 [Mycena rebaudengoi]|nr:hypothetical protein C8J57DRAFT_242455 [Mycena rebaudengoi]
MFHKSSAYFLTAVAMSAASALAMPKAPSEYGSASLSAPPGEVTQPPPSEVPPIDSDSVPQASKSYDDGQWHGDKSRSYDDGQWHDDIHTASGAQASHGAGNCGHPHFHGHHHGGKSDSSGHGHVKTMQGGPPLASGGPGAPEPSASLDLDSSASGSASGPVESEYGGDEPLSDDGSPSSSGLSSAPSDSYMSKRRRIRSVLPAEVDTIPDSEFDLCF